MKPFSCSPCPLYNSSPAFGHPDGAQDAPLLIVGEAMGRDEEAAALAHFSHGLSGPEFFVGPSGGFLWRRGKRAGFERKDVRVGNVLQCRPANDWLSYAPWEFEAIRNCAQYREPLLNEPHQAILTLGVTATREVLKHFGHHYEGSLDEWHGYVIGDGSHPWIIPTYHPAFLLNSGQLKLTGVLIHDFSLAHRAATEGFEREEADLVVDPPVEWFRAWAELVGPESWLAVDIETPEGTDHSNPQDPSWQILRVNFAVNREQGVTVPFSYPYTTIIKALLERVHWQWYWFGSYDTPRLRRYDIDIKGYYDAMDGWHMLQSDMGGSDKDPRDKSSRKTVRGNALGFVAPFFSSLPPWKHLSWENPGYYAAMDGVQTWRCVDGISQALHKQGQWEVFRRHFGDLDRYTLRPAEREGLLVDRDALAAFSVKLQERIGALEVEIQTLVPEEILPLTPKGGLKKLPEGFLAPPAGGHDSGPHPTPLRALVRLLDAPEGTAEGVWWRLEEAPTQVCLTCGAQEVTKAHKCGKSDTAGASLALEDRVVPRYYRRSAFNPNSPDQVRAYMAVKGLKTKKGKKAKTDKPTTEHNELVKLARKDPFFAHILSLREVKKTKGTYVEGVGNRLDSDGRVHTTFMHRPSNMRLSSVDPGMQNVTLGEEDDSCVDAACVQALGPHHRNEHPWDASGFRRCIIAGEGAILQEYDYSAIEAVITGWYCEDPSYIRLAQAGIHAYLVGMAVDPKKMPRYEELPGVELDALKKLLKPYKLHKLYPKKKRTVHAVNYGMAAFGIAMTYPELFDSPRDAQKELDFYFALAPRLKEWQASVRNQATKQNYLGGSDHPFRYKHWFWDVVQYDSRYEKWRPGTDSNRVVAFKPASTAAGVQKEAALRLTDPMSPYFIGDWYYGRTPMRLLIHDSFLTEIPIEKKDAFREQMLEAMTLPVPELPCPPEWGMGGCLSFGVGVKEGRAWGEM